MLRLVQGFKQTLQELQPRAAILRTLYENSRKVLFTWESDKDEDIQVKRRALEATRRDLVETERQIEEIQEKLAALDHPHPIRRCPVDIMQYIFQKTAESACNDVDYFYISLQLSHVCYQWRQIAINTSILWVRLVASISTSADVINDCWSQITLRVVNRPVRISILLLGESYSYLTFKGIRGLNLEQFAKVESVWLCVNQPRVAEQLALATITLPSSGINAFQIGAYWGSQDQYFRLDPTSLIIHHAVDGLKSVVLNNIDFQYFTSTAIFATIRSLKIANSINIQLSHLVRAFPNVKRVTILLSSVFAINSVESEEKLEWPQLKSLVAQCHADFPYDMLKLPKLQELYLPEQGLNCELRGFMDTHSHLKVLDIKESGCYCWSRRYNLAQITTLTIGTPRNLQHVVWPEFVNLLYLTIYDTCRHFELSLRKFDRIVQTLCLPSDDSAENWVPPLFTILKREYASDSDWKRSRWILPANKAETFVTFWGKKYRLFRFQWP